MNVETVTSQETTAVRFVDSPIGTLRIAADANGLREIRFLRERDARAAARGRTETDRLPARSSDDQAIEEQSGGRSRDRAAEAIAPGSSHGHAADSRTEAERIATMTMEQLSEYFDGKRSMFELPLAPRGTAFQQQVWNSLLSIPFGELVSYGEIARRIGLPRASRAVGAANGANPIPIVIPCHRVIGASGTLTGYGGGLDIKEKLLLLEGIGIDGQGSRAARVASHQVSLLLRTSDPVARNE